MPFNSLRNKVFIFLIFALFFILCFHFIFDEKGANDMNKGVNKFLIVTIFFVLNAFFIFLGLIPLIFAYSCSVYISNTSVFSELIKNYNIPSDAQGFVYFWIINFSYLLMIPLFMLGMVFLCCVL